MRRFLLWRRVDATGTSGSGVVAEGVVCGDGSCVLRWRTATRSTAVYDSVADLLAIHGHGGATVPLWLDAEDQAPRECTVFRAEGPKSGEPGVVRPTCWVESGAVDRNGRAVKAGCNVKIAPPGELSERGTVNNVHVGPTGEVMVSVFGVSCCGQAAFPIAEVEVVP